MDGWLGSQKGTLPEELGVLTEIVYFELQYRENDLTGTIPRSIGRSWTKLTAFLVAWNRLHGSFPFENNPLLGTIFFNDNKIEDNIEKLTTLQSLSWLEAETNNFTGTLPEAFIELPYLWKVRLTNNSLTGAIPDTFTNASLLESFLVSGNRFTGG
jgi:Leucine-rich repeat (LRR) protein